MKQAPWSIWEKRCEVVSASIDDLGGEVAGLILKPPAGSEQIVLLEQELEVKLPDSFVRVLTEYASEMKFSWSLPEQEDLPIPLPNELEEIFRGGFHWSLDRLKDIETNRQGWQAAVFPDPDHPYDSVWHHKLAFMEVGNGDFIAFDLSEPADYPVVYLSHDDGEGHGYRLGDQFIDFMNRWTSIGCAGPEDWQFIPFIQSPKTGIDPECANAAKWRSWLNMKAEE